mgnify:CR=1 FL=1
MEEARPAVTCKVIPFFPRIRNPGWTAEVHLSVIQSSNRDFFVGRIQSPEGG